MQAKDMYEFFKRLVEEGKGDFDVRQQYGLKYSDGCLCVDDKNRDVYIMHT